MPTRPALNLDGCRIVVAEDAPPLRFCLLELLAPTRATCIAVANGIELDEALCQAPAALVISDVRMPMRSGVDVLRDRRAANDSTPFILVSGSPGLVDIVGLDPVVMLGKPFTADELMAAVAHALGSEREPSAP
jgi:DNA-binding NtrC family response regulator